MNDRMWAHRQTALNVAHLRELGYVVLDPEEGPLAAGEGGGPGACPSRRRSLRTSGGCSMAMVCCAAGALW